ncbi:unnamed protein product, partial [Prunus brigantina]
GYSSKPTESWIWACATVKRNGSCLCRVYVFPFGLVFIGMWTAFSSVLCFLADHSSWILGLYIVSLLLRLGRMEMLLRLLLKFVMGQYVGYLKFLGRVVHCRRLGFF